MRIDSSSNVRRTGLLPMAAWKFSFPTSFSFSLRLKFITRISRRLSLGSL